MKFIINNKIFEDFDSPFIGVVVVNGVNNKKSHPEIANLLRKAEENLRLELNTETLSEHPSIACWREAYRKFGAKPRDFRCSIEALSRIVLRGSEIRTINTLVDLYNLISIKYLLPLGGEDLDKMKGELQLTYASGNEEYTPLHGEENDPPKEGEVIYKDDLGVICRRWNWREGDRTKITEDTKNVILVIESLAPIEQNIIKQATEELVELIKKYCGGEIKIFFLSNNTKEVSFDF